MEAKHDGINPTRWSLERAHTFLPMHGAGGLRSQPFLAALRSLAPRVTMQSEMRVVSGDVKERADILKGQIDGAEFSLSGGDHRTSEGESDPAVET